jgi:DNA-binding NtrC family response regulator
MSDSACLAPRPILLIDDDELIAGSLRDYLLARGWDVHVALEPAAAVARMAERQYGIILVDPYLTGSIHSDNDVLIETIRTLQPRSSIIVLTGYGSSTILQAAAADESTTLLFKPQSILHLSDLIHRIPMSSSE